MPDLKPCPNPECQSMRHAWKHRIDMKWVRCADCGMSGPRGQGAAEAARLWNALPRNVTPDVSSTQDCPAGHDKRRDYFAAKAMQTLLAMEDYRVSGFPESIAIDAWRVADAMVEHREGVSDGDE